MINHNVLKYVYNTLEIILKIKLILNLIMSLVFKTKYTKQLSQIREKVIFEEIKYLKILLGFRKVKELVS